MHKSFRSYAFAVCNFNGNFLVLSLFIARRFQSSRFLPTLHFISFLQLAIFVVIADHFHGCKTQQGANQNTTIISNALACEVQ